MKVVKKGVEDHQGVQEEFWVVDPHDDCLEEKCRWGIDRIKIVFHEGQWFVEGNSIWTKEQVVE